jgi:hypothetical protein
MFHPNAARSQNVTVPEVDIGDFRETALGAILSDILYH